MPVRHGEKWTAEEEERLYNGIRNAVPFTEIAQAHQRGIGGIMARCKKLGLVDDDNNPVKPLPDFVPSAMISIKTPQIEEGSGPVTLPVRADIEPHSDFSPDALCTEGAIGVRLCNGLKKMGVEDVRQAFDFTDWDFLRQDNLGRKTLQEWKAFKEQIVTHTVLEETSHQEEYIVPSDVLPEEKDPIFSEKQIRHLQRDVNLLKAIAAYDKYEAGRHILQLRNILFALKKHVRYFDKAMNSLHFDDEKRLDFEEEYKENGTTSQKILDIIDDIITFHIKDERAAHILRLRLGGMENNGTLTLQEIGDLASVSKERIRQLEKKAMRTLIACVQKRTPLLARSCIIYVRSFLWGRKNLPLR